jgi:hypothetical protein
LTLDELGIITSARKEFVKNLSKLKGDKRICCCCFMNRIDIKLERIERVFSFQGFAFGLGRNDFF